MKTLILFAVILLIVCAIVWRLSKRYYERKLDAVYEELLLKLDRAIGGTFSEAVYDESLDGAVTERLNRVVSICRRNQEKAEAERDFIKGLISDISHQIRTPLTNIMLYTGLLQERQLDQDTMLLAGKIRRQSEKLDFFMKELIKSAYAEQEMISIHPEMTGVEELIGAACQMTELAALKKGIEIVIEEAGGFCYADKKWTIEALGNVLDNAVKYSPPNSKVRVRTVSYESFVCIQVEDQGIGIREEEQGSVFERFYRSKDVSSEPGVGIGLYLVREILSRQGGYVKLASEKGKGTVVCLYLLRREI